MKVFYPANDAAPVQSPCTGICTLGPNSLCIGCLRSSEEISRWVDYSEVERGRILADLPNRLRTLFAR